MFVGSVPDALVHQLIRSIDFKAWPSIHVICSGSFKLERAIRAIAPGTKLYSNDVSLLSCALGRLAIGEAMPLKFVGALDWIEPLVGDDLHDRLAAVLIAMEVQPYSIGNPTIYKTRHLDTFKRTFPILLDLARKRVAALRAQLVIDGFHAGDFREHIAAAREAGSAVIGFPPTYRGGYEQLYRFLHANVEWDAPAYATFDPADLPAIVDDIDAAGQPFVMLTDQPLPGRSPTLELIPGRKHPILGYASEGKPSFMRSGQTSATPFAYGRIVPDKLTTDSLVELTLCDAGKAAFVKDVYLAKHITHSNGEVNVLVYVDKMLAGLIVFARSRVQVYHGNEIYLLSDLSTTREAKLSKLIARLSTCSEIIRFLEHHYLRRFEYVVTTAFAKAPVSMKYRGVFDLLKRAETDNGFMLNYGRGVTGESAADVYRWWWDKYGKAEIAT